MAIAFPQRFLLTQCRQLLDVTGGKQVALLEVTGDIMTPNTLTNNAIAFKGHITKGPGAFAAVAGLDHIHVAAVAVNDLSTVTPRSAKTHSGGLKHHDLNSLFGKMQRRRDSGETRSHHAHLALDFPIERRTLRHRVRS